MLLTVQKAVLTQQRVPMDACRVFRHTDHGSCGIGQFKQGEAMGGGIVVGTGQIFCLWAVMLCRGRKAQGGEGRGTALSFNQGFFFKYVCSAFRTMWHKALSHCDCVLSSDTSFLIVPLIFWLKMY